jgi:2-methylcitrate dehydratase
MPDKIVDAIAGFAAGRIRLREDVVREVKRRVIDSVGCFLGAWKEELVERSRKAVLRYACGMGASTLWGGGEKTTPDWAAFVNGAGVRALDFNDTYLSKEPLHPSDMIPAIIAVGEAVKASGRDVVEAVAVGYEVGCRLCDAATLRKRGWDHVNFTMVGAAAAVGRLMGLGEEALANALAMAVVPHVAMRQTRVGELSMWKGAAAADACRQAVYACMLAEQGVTGPSQPFEGEMGFFNQVSGPFTLEEFTDEPNMILKTYIKYHPVEYHAMTAVDAVMKLRGRVGEPGDVVKIVVETFEAAYTILAKHPEKWRPATRETADHSLPYIVAAAFLDNGVWLDSFSPARIAAEDIRNLIPKIDVVEDPALTARYPGELPNRVRIYLRDGRELAAEESLPKGHYKNPMSDGEVEAKFKRLVSKTLTVEKMSSILDAVWRLDRLGDVRELAELVTVG